MMVVEDTLLKQNQTSAEVSNSYLAVSTVNTWH